MPFAIISQRMARFAQLTNGRLFLTGKITSTETPRKAAPFKAEIKTRSGKKYGVMIRTVFFAQERTVNNIQFNFSKSSFGPLQTALQIDEPVGPTFKLVIRGSC